jgi:hypothetical protein
MEKIVYEHQLNAFVNLSLLERPEFKDYFRFECLADDIKQPSFDTHYVYHVAWAIAKILASPPIEHTDISSSLNFCSAICSVVPTTFIDYRPVNLVIDNLKCAYGDLTDSDQWEDNQFSSLSCMHVVEHIGLGRYGDKLDVNGDLLALSNLRRAVKPGGRLLIVVPVGKPAVYFNAHRVYSAKWIHDFFSVRFWMKEFFFIPGPMSLPPQKNCEFSAADGVSYGCGCFEFICC